MESDELVLSAITSYLGEMEGVLRKLPLGLLSDMICRLEDARLGGRAVFTCGNGGSAATAIHFASDLAKGAAAPDKPPFRAMSLCENVSLVTAWANDLAYDEVFARRLAPWVKAGDVLVAISGSGNSPNVLRAADVARAAGATVLGLTGFDGGRLKDLSDLCLIVPCSNMEQIEDFHLLVCHVMTTSLRGHIPLRADLGLVEMPGHEPPAGVGVREFEADKAA